MMPYLIESGHLGEGALRSEYFCYQNFENIVYYYFLFISSQLSWSKNPIYWIVQRDFQQIPSAFWPYIPEL